MIDKPEDAISHVQHELNEATRYLSKSQYVEVLEELIDDFEVRCETAKAEQDDEEV